MITRSEVITRYMDDVGNKIVNKYGRKWPSYFDDFRSVAMHTIWKVIEARGPDVPIKVLGRAIKQDIVEALFSLVPILGPKPRTRRKNHDYTLPEVLEFAPEHDRPIYDDIDAEDILCSLAHNKQEYIIMSLRVDGYTLSEIGDALGFHHTYIFKVLKRIKLREK